MTGPYTHLLGSPDPYQHLLEPTAPRLPGLLTSGNIDLAHRPRVRNADGSISTVRSMSFGEDGREVLIPTVSDDGRIMADSEAIDAYHRSGRHLGIFADQTSATSYATQLHKDQAVQLGNDPYAHLLRPTDEQARSAARATEIGARFGSALGPQFTQVALGHAGILTRNEIGRARDQAAAPGKVMRGLSAVSDAATTAVGGAVKDLDTVGRLVSAGSGDAPEDRELATKPANELIGAGVRTAANVAAPLLPEVRAAGGLVSRLAGRAGVSALTNAGISGGVTLATTRDIAEAARAARQGAVVGGVSGLVLGGVGEGLTARQARLTARRVAAPPSSTPASVPTPVSAPTPTAADVALAGGAERHAGLSLPSDVARAIRTGYRSAVVTPYAEIEQQTPALAQALTRAGASSARAEHIAGRRLGWVLEGLDDQQKSTFGTKLTYDNLVAEAERKAQATARTADPVEAATLLHAARNFEQHARAMQPRVVPNVEAEPWFQSALAKYKTHIEGPLTQDALASGVDPASLRQPATAYVKLASEARLDDADIRRALDVAGVKDPSELQQRPALLRKLVGENPALARYFARNAGGARQGPLAANAGYPGEPAPVSPNRVGVTGSAKMAQGTAQEYATDVGRIVDVDARDKAVKAARNAIWQQVSQVGRKLEPGEAPAFGRKVLAFDDTKGLVDPDAGTLRYEVTPEIHAAVRHALAPEPVASAGGRMVRKVSDVATRAQISGMPVEATSHANTLASIIASVPGEKDVAGKVMAAVPGFGAKAAAIREMFGIDFSAPEARALESRLADVGALRPHTEHGGILNSASDWLFGPEGVDVRGRMVLARKLLDRNPNATDEELRQFVVAKLGNYIGKNSTALTNLMAKGSVFSPFARFQTARIPTSVQSTLGVSGLPASGPLQRASDVANTLYRGPVGYLAGANALNYALTGHSTLGNEAGHALDVATGLSAVPGGVQRTQEGDDPKAAPLFLPAATLNPVAYTGLRATGLRSLIGPLSPDRGTGGRAAGAIRDVANVGLGTAGPLMRGLATATTGRVPYLQNDNSFMRVTPTRYSEDAELGDRVRAALGLANPAVKAFAMSGGEGGRTLAHAMEDEDKTAGGLPSVLARVAEFTLPRVLSPGVGGRTNEQSVESQMEHRLRDAQASYVQQIRQAPGPRAVDDIIAEARRDAARSGFDPDAMVVALEKAAAQDQQQVADRRNAQRDRRMQKLRVP